MIFEIEENTPVWSPDHEDNDEFYGTFLMRDNVFHERCGVYINGSGEFCIDIQPRDPSWPTKGKRKMHPN